MAVTSIIVTRAGLQGLCRCSVPARHGRRVLPVRIRDQHGFFIASLSHPIMPCPCNGSWKDNAPEPLDVCPPNGHH